MPDAELLGTEDKHVRMHANSAAFHIRLWTNLQGDSYTIQHKSLRNMCLELLQRLPHHAHPRMRALRLGLRIHGTSRLLAASRQWQQPLQPLPSAFVHER